MAPATFSPGHLFAGRYRVVELLGVGHTAEVYLAQDESLARQVVVKCLVPELEQHEEVRRAFRTRVVAAAPLHHPHLAPVLDGGQEDGHIFMVSAYLPGGSLEDLLQRGVRLSPDETARLARDCASAIALLHENGIVHGELSPSKLLFDAEGAVRISDVALAGLGVAFRSYATGEDVRYFSPEQARGDVATSTTDVYALALVLFEAATGVVPFGGHSAEATLRARMTSPLPSRPELGTLDVLLAQASVPDAAQRCSAQQLLDRLSAVVADDGDFALPAASEPTALLAGFVAAEPRSSIGFRPPSASDIVGSAPPVSSSDGALYEPSRRAVPSGLSSLEGLRSKRRRPGLLLGALALIVLAGGGIAAWGLGYFTTTHTVPALTGLSLGDAATLIKADGWTLQISQARSPSVPTNNVISQSPAAGATLANGGMLSVVVSSGSGLVSLPRSLVGATCPADVTTLTALYLRATCSKSSTVASASIPAGRVAQVRYQSTVNPLAVPAGAIVTLILSSGPVAPATTTTTTTTTPPTHGVRAVPNLVGLSRSAVNLALHNAELFYSTRGPGANSPQWRHVTSTVPASGTKVPWHSTIILNVTR